MSLKLFQNVYFLGASPHFFVGTTSLDITFQALDKTDVAPKVCVFSSQGK